ncbi:Muscle-specific protein 20-like protein [Dinothrombium tinctorium]|uniref:Muscle-specific protein 20-like protein n=1 Tax=Dinothrombium tinctorium TaxID=1965070 RepID=A0A443RHS0_9ACAR|nr:Muscle-specific protein 20-like protein [Dinothrombium tinctorium]
MNAVKEGSIKGEITAGENLKQKRENVERFLTAVREYGVEKQHLFEVEDLLLMQNIPRVTNCLFELGKLAAKDPNFKGPHLGEKPYEAIDPRTKRRAGMPEGDDIHVAHVDIKILKKMMSIEG